MEDKLTTCWMSGGHRCTMKEMGGEKANKEEEYSCLFWK
jgi:hypothetical protein